MTKPSAWVVGCVGVCLSGVAQAGSAATRPGSKSGFGSSNVEVRLKAGLSGYTGSLGEVFEVGPAVGVSVDTRGGRPLGLEISYDGARNAVSGEYIVGAGSIWQHTLSVLLKAGHTFRELSPFVAAGLGASFVDATDLARAEGFGNDVLAELPLAVGADYRIGPLSAGLRGTYRFIFSEDIATRPGPGPSPSGNALGGAVSVGSRF